MQITIVKKDKAELNMQLKKAQQARSVDATMPFKVLIHSRQKHDCFVNRTRKSAI